MRRLLINKRFNRVAQRKIGFYLGTKVRDAINEQLFAEWKHDRQAIKKTRDVRPVTVPITGDSLIESKAYVAAENFCGRWFCRRAPGQAGFEIRHISGCGPEKL
ncbi:hypothetical protein D3C84_701370 [compost metagenome]